MIQWLRLHAPNARAQVCSLIGDIASPMLHSMAKKRSGGIPWEFSLWSSS